MRWLIVVLLVLLIAYYKYISKPPKKTIHMEGFCQGVSSFREHTLMGTRVTET